jgi:hypothetical protein
MKRNLDHLPKLHELVRSHRKRRIATFMFLRLGPIRINRQGCGMRGRATDGSGSGWQGIFNDRPGQKFRAVAPLIDPHRNRMPRMRTHSVAAGSIDRDAIVGRAAGTASSKSAKPNGVGNNDFLGLWNCGR